MDHHIYSEAERKEAIAQGGRLYSGTWKDWYTRCCADLLDAEIAFTSEMFGAYQISNKLRDLYINILWATSHANKTEQPAETVYPFTRLEQRFLETFACWYQNWLDFGPDFYHWNPYERGALGVFLGGFWGDEDD